MGPLMSVYGTELANLLLREESPMNTSNQRSFKRVDDYLPYTYRRISRDEYEVLEKKYLSGTLCEAGVTPLPEPWGDLTGQTELDHPHAELLAGIIKYFHLIDQKLNTILDVLACGKENSLFLKAPAKINISGSGVKFATEEKVQKGDYLEIRIALPGCPLSVIPALGQVVHASPSTGPGRQEVAVHFTAISEQAREDLTRYILRMERALLRSQSERGLRSVEHEK
jgi:hypothetical protein